MTHTGVILSHTGLCYNKIYQFLTFIDFSFVVTRRRTYKTSEQRGLPVLPSISSEQGEIPFLEGQSFIFGEPSNELPDFGRNEIDLLFISQNISFRCAKSMGKCPYRPGKSTERHQQQFLDSRIHQKAIRGLSFVS
ncbi:hypothetical protein CEXT_501381 [Caerostris extrusa]|uniref:Uncharacterized protein n=1 Tax=Caerostris extrusa TaxID=172846 RepID=A0AAV4SS56_CAEEX|nr:hypothetical protein CEXT_501381 [Caerostris extrusa]